jgi:hypothetical protein
MEPSPPAILTTLSFALFTTSLPNQSSTTSGILSILPLHHSQPSTVSANSIDHIPSSSSTDHISLSSSTNHLPRENNNSQIKNEANPPPQPPPQTQEPQQQSKAFPTHGTILTINGGSNTDFNTKRQHRDYYREVNHIVVKGPITQTKWSHIPKTFSTQDVNPTSFPHADVMVLTVHIDRWDVSKILVDNGSQVEILFLSTFEKWVMI